MVGYTENKPEEFVRSGGGWQYRYNIQEVPATNDRPVTYQYDYVEVQSIDRSTIIDALITAKYSYASQLGKLALSRTSSEWLAYNSFRQECYQIVDEALARRA